MDVQEERRKRVLDGLKMTHQGETICLSHEQAKTLVDWIDELERMIEWGSEGLNGR